ncbi:MAG: glycosyltransferase family 2 protein, partial [Alphaproteobacteria bacterium]
MGIHIVKDLALRRTGVIVWSIFKDEIRIVRQWLHHYRTMGASAFIVLDDQSSDGTRELLAEQSDCLVLGSDEAYGALRDGKTAHEHWLDEIPRRHLQGRWGMLADADEFLILPPPYERLDQFAADLDRIGEECCSAAMVDFYPEFVRDIDVPLPPGRSPFEIAPFF